MEEEPRLLNEMIEEEISNEVENLKSLEISGDDMRKMIGRDALWIISWFYIQLQPPAFSYDEYSYLEL